MQEKNTTMQNQETLAGDWTALYRLAGVGMIVVIGFIVFDIALSFTGADVPSGSLTAEEWLAYFQRNPLYGLRNLGLLNVLNLLLTLPLYLALYQLHRQHSPAIAALAFALFLLGSAVYIANNRALALLALSQEFASAAGEAQKAWLVSAAASMLAQAEDFTPGAFTGFALSSTASLCMMVVLLRGNVFRKWVGFTGLVGAGLLLIFTTWVTFAPETFEAAMVIALIGGLLMLAWDIRMVIGMFRFGRLSMGSNEMRARRLRLEKEL
jgi:hypothetical protein